MGFVGSTSVIYEERLCKSLKLASREHAVRQEDDRTKQNINVAAYSTTSETTFLNYAQWFFRFFFTLGFLVFTAVIVTITGRNYGGF
jgi:hypothetical protein